MCLIKFCQFIFYYLLRFLVILLIVKALCNFLKIIINIYIKKKSISKYLAHEQEVEQLNVWGKQTRIHKFYCFQYSQKASHHRTFILTQDYRHNTATESGIIYPCFFKFRQFIIQKFKNILISPVIFQLWQSEYTRDNLTKITTNI